MIKPLYKMCVDFPTQYCNPNACGKYKICKLLRISRMAEMIATIIATCELISNFDEYDNDDEGDEWKNE